MTFMLMSDKPEAKRRNLLARLYKMNLIFLWSCDKAFCQIPKDDLYSMQIAMCIQTQTIESFYQLALYKTHMGSFVMTVLILTQ